MLHGVSMGGATVLMTSGERLPEQVKCIVADCAYTSVKEILTYQAKRMYRRFPAHLLLGPVSLISRLRAGYFFGEASALRQVSKNSRPVLFLHGAEDTFVPVEMIHPLYEASQGYKEKVIVPKAGHGLAYSADVSGYRKRVGDFLGKFMD